MNSTSTISVVIPARNEEAYLSACLASLNHQQGIGAYEIIVVDNGSSDQTAAIAKGFGATVVTEIKPGVAGARQAGFQAARGEIIATTDADSEVPPRWLQSLLGAFDLPRVVAAGGPVQYVTRQPVVQELFDRTIPVLHQLDRLLHRGSGHLVGANLAVRRSAFEKIGGFRTTLDVGEDLDFTHRLQVLGEIVFVPNLKVKTSDRRFRSNGPLQLWRYFQAYLEITQPNQAMRAQLAAFFERHQQLFPDLAKSIRSGKWPTKN